MFHLRGKKYGENNSSDMDNSVESNSHPASVFSTLFHSGTNSAAAVAVGGNNANNNHAANPSRPSSIASSSGFASLGSGGALASFLKIYQCLWFINMIVIERKHITGISFECDKAFAKGAYREGQSHS